MFTTTALGAVGLSAASSIGAATDGVSSDSLIADARFDQAFSGQRVDDPDAPIKTGRWAEDAAPVELAGGPTTTPATDPPPEPIRLSVRASTEVSANPAIHVAAVEVDDLVASPPMAIPLSRVAWAPSRREPVAKVYEPRISLGVAEVSPSAAGSGLDAGSAIFNEPLLTIRETRSSPLFDMKRLTIRLGPSKRVGKKGRWFVFAAGSGEAFGLNLIRDPLQGWKPAGWSVEQLAEFGKAQLGIGWRKGARQISLSAARREISAYGLSREDTVFGITFSVSGRPPAKTRFEQRLPKP